MTSAKSPLEILSLTASHLVTRRLAPSGSGGLTLGNLEELADRARMREPGPEQGVHGQGDPHVALPGSGLDGVHDQTTAVSGSPNEPRSNPGTGFVANDRGPVSERDHLAVHAVHADALALDQTHRSRQVSKRGIPGVPRRQD